MKLKSCHPSWPTLLLLGLSLSLPTNLYAQGLSQPFPGPAPGGPPDPAQVQVQGPVHEAFAQPIPEQPAPSPVVPQEPPPPINEQPPAERPAGEGVEWIPGYWSWSGEQNQFVWVSGVWRQPPPGQNFVPGYWDFDGQGWRWVSGFWGPAQQQELNYFPQPPAPRENGPVLQPPNDNNMYAPGHWEWRVNRFAWFPGEWMVPQPGMVWVPAHYVWTPAGYAFVAGYWDYAPQDRGLIFAPVVFNQPVWQTPGYVYTPRYALDWGVVLDSLFLDPGYSNYYYGNYYSNWYTNRGYRPWFHQHHRYWDPLSNYYAYHNRHNGTWLGQLNTHYRNRLSGVTARPGVGLAGGGFAVRSLGAGATNRFGNSVQLVSLRGQTTVSPSRLVSLSSKQVTVQRNQAVQIRNAGVARGQAERRTVVAGGQASRRGPVALPTQRWNLPQVASASRPPNLAPAFPGTKGPGGNNASRFPGNGGNLGNLVPGNLTPGNRSKVAGGAPSLPNSGPSRTPPTFSQSNRSGFQTPPTFAQPKTPAFSQPYRSGFQTPPTFAQPKGSGFQTPNQSPKFAGPSTPKFSAANTVRTTPYTPRPTYSSPSIRPAVNGSTAPRSSGGSSQNKSANLYRGTSGTPNLYRSAPSPRPQQTVSRPQASYRPAPTASRSSSPRTSSGSRSSSSRSSGGRGSSKSRR